MYILFIATVFDIESNSVMKGDFATQREVSSIGYKDSIYMISTVMAFSGVMAI